MVEHAATLPLPSWESFYVIVGSSAAALTGLQFVVIVLGAEVKAIGSHTTRAFATPTVVHFCAVLLISAVLSAPWSALFGPAVALAITGAFGIGYTVNVVRVTRQQSEYQPVFEDWLFHTILPFTAYATVLVSALVLVRDPVDSLFAVGASTVLLLFIGIHNAWDAVTYLAQRGNHKAADDEQG